MNKDREVLELCNEVFKSIGLKRFSNRLEKYLEKPNNDAITGLYSEACLFDDFSEKNRKKVFTFGNEYSLLKYFIISFQKEYDDDGNPVIVINKLEDETASFKDNPIKNLFIKYKDEELRDIDFERLQLIMR